MSRGLCLTDPGTQKEGAGREGCVAGERVPATGDVTVAWGLQGVGVGGFLQGSSFKEQTLTVQASDCARRDGAGVGVLGNCRLPHASLLGSGHEAE